VHMIGPEVSELLPELTLAQQNELTTLEIAHNIHTHPTLSEAILEAAEMLNGSAIHI
jgi:dihydrolipoamide dehydrogenase